MEDIFIIKYGDIKRRTFLKRIGILSGTSLMELVVPVGFLSSKKWPTRPGNILVPDMGRLSYWEMLMFSCFQGLCNRDQANIFFYYPKKSRESWYSKYPVEEIRVFYEWYKQYDHLRFEEIQDPYRLFDDKYKNYRKNVKGLVLVNSQEPEVVNIAANYASIEGLLPITENILQREEIASSGLSVKRDLRGKFQGRSKLEINKWAFEHQWPLCNHSRVANLGTPKASENIPTNSFYTSNRARDFTVAEGGFFFNLASKDEDYDLKDQILKEMEPMGYVFGWHQGAGETAHINHLSKHAQLALGTSTYAANFSFHSRVDIPGAVERFRRKTIQQSQPEEIKEKIYLTFVLSDGDSLNFLTRRGQGGQWQLPERGKIPFGWEIQPLLADVAPGLLDYFQATATKNDYFVNGVSGIGYFYPEEVPKDKLRMLLNETKKYIKTTGLSELSVMSPSRAVTEETMQIYEEVLGQELFGVMEGYERRKAKTIRLFRHGAEGRMVWMPTSNPKGEKTIENWVQGLKKVAKHRKQRPLFIPLHVPAHRLTITDVVKIIDQLGEEFEVLAPRAFYELFMSTREDAVSINPPESFPSEKIELIAGEDNILNPVIQNFGKSEKRMQLEIKVGSNKHEKTVLRSQTVQLKSYQTSEFKITIFIPSYFQNSEGEVVYRIGSDKKNKVMVPVSFK